MKDFNIELENWTKANVDSLKLIHTEANECLKYTVALAIRISNRAYTLISILISALTIITSVIFNHHIGANPISTDWMIYAVVFCIPLVVSLIILIRIVLPEDFMRLGSKPNRIARADFIQHPEYPDNMPYIALLMGEIENLEYRININDEVNNRRLWYLKFVMLMLSTLLISTAIMTMAFSIFT